MIPLKDKSKEVFTQNTTLHKVTHLHARFQFRLHPAKIEQLRGAVVAVMGREYDLLHNHNPTKKDTSTAYIKRYPLIQYRSEQGKAAIYAWGAGVPVLKRFLLDHEFIQLGNYVQPLKIIHLREQEQAIELAPQMDYTYRIPCWIALNEKNYKRWRKNDALVPRVQLLESILRGQIVALLEGLGMTELPQIKVELIHLRGTRPVRAHGQPRIAFHILFRTNIILPNRIGLGRSVAFGYGAINAISM